MPGPTAWSPCERFIASSNPGVVEIRDGATLTLLNTFESSSGTEDFVFSPDSRLLTKIPYRHPMLVTWDLQTGGSVDTAFPEDMYSVISSTYSIDGKMLAVVYSKKRSPAALIATHDLSASRTHLHRVSEGHIIPPIWTHGELLRFATVEPKSIIIWEAEFTLTHPPEVVESLPLPDEVGDVLKSISFLFFPSLSRLAITRVDALINRPFLSLWDVRHSKLLLKTNLQDHATTFSSHGRVFVSQADGFFVWKETPAGYVLHHKYPVFRELTSCSLSPNGESILISSQSTLRLVHTKDGPILPSRISSELFLFEFVLAFSPDELSVAFARKFEKTVTILDLQSGDPQLTIDTGVEVRGLGMTGSAIVVASKCGVLTWSLTAGDDRTKFTSDIVRTATFDCTPDMDLPRVTDFTSVSPGLSHIVISGLINANDNKAKRPRDISMSLRMYDVPTGRCIAIATPLDDDGVLKSLFLVINSGY